VAIENARLFESVRSALAETTELKALMDNVFESIASGVITTDEHNRITMSNRAAQEIIGQPADWLKGRAIEQVFPSFGDSLKQYIHMVCKTNANIIGVEVEVTLPGRPPANLSLNLSPLNRAIQGAPGVAIVLEDLTEKRRLQSQRRLFERMVSPAVIEQIDPEQLSVGGRRAHITTLFADIRDFTHFSEAHDPELLVSVLNRYLAAAAQAVLAHQGTIDKFLGDAVMAWFNAPIPQPDHALHAVKAALEMQAAVRQLHDALPEEHHLSLAVGIHYGDAVLGLVGTEERLDYTAIGDSVNTAKRIQENAAPGQILISADVLKQIGEGLRVRPVASIPLKGKSQPMQVYEVLGLA
jgi:PAS domain S-box-containing protein